MATPIGTFDAEAWAEVFFQLLPPSRHWKRDGVLMDVFLACGDELELLSGRIKDLITESNPATASELLEDYEDELGLDHDGTDSERQTLIVARIGDFPSFSETDVEAAMAWILDLDAADVDVYETTNAMAVALADETQVFHFFVFRDPALSGTYDVDDAQAELDRIKHSHTQGTVIESVSLLCDNAYSLTDRDLFGV